MNSRPTDATLSLAIFFLKTYFFNPLNNPVFVTCGVLVAFFAMEGSLDRHHAALMLYLAIPAHLFVGNMFRESVDEEEPGAPPIRRWFRVLPVRGGQVYVAYLLAAAAYAIAFCAVFGFVLARLMRPPDIEPLDTLVSVGPDGDTITTLRGFAYSPRGIPSFVTLAIEKSLFFDFLAKGPVAPLFIAGYYVLAFLYVSAYHVYRQFGAAGGTRPGQLANRIPLAFVLLLGAAFAAELVLSQKEMGDWTRALLGSVDLVSGVFAAMLAATAVSTALMSRSILVRLRGAG